MSSLKVFLVDFFKGCSCPIFTFFSANVEESDSFSKALEEWIRKRALLYNLEDFFQQMSKRVLLSKWYFLADFEEGAAVQS